MKYCSKKHGNPDDAEFCHECGEKLQEKKRKGVRMCPRCGTASLDYGYCTHCGYIFSSGGTMPGYKMPFIKIKHCLKCGVANPKDAEFCFKCGCKLGEPLSFPPQMEKRLKYLQDRKKKCRECGELNLTFAAFCIKCGHKFEEQSEGENKTESSLSSKISNSGEKVCQKCKAVNPNDAEFCAGCGASLTLQPKPKPQSTHRPQPTPMPQPKSEPQSSYSSNSSNNLSWGCLLVPLLFGVIAILICVYGGFWKDFWLYVGIGSLLVGIEELIKKLKRLF